MAFGWRNKRYNMAEQKIGEVKRFKGYLCTMDNRVVIDCIDGT